MKKSVRIYIFLLLCIVIQSHGQPIQRYNIIINEIMADPSPEIGLPAVEYIELHNRLAEPCTLTNWSITIGTSKKQLPTLFIDGLGYAVLVAQKNAVLMQPFCQNLYTLSSLSIADAGQTIILSNESNQVIHAVSFSKKWHTEVIKQEGGWSLELLDDHVPCQGQENWDSSVADLGGTPGASNASAQPIEDNAPPVMERATLLNDSTVRIIFSESVQLYTHTSEPPFETTPLIPIEKIREVAPFFNALDLTFSEPLHPNVHYLLCLQGNLADCAGNEALPHCMHIGKPSVPVARDIIINEVLFQPFSGSDAEFIEIFNRSSKIIDLKALKIGYGGDTLPLKTINAVSSGKLLFPQEYCVLCKNKQATLKEYFCPAPTTLQQSDSLPTLSNNEGIIFLTDNSLHPIDRFAYSHKMHFSGLNQYDGVSLERLHTERATQDDNNWHSASIASGFATPGYKNSQAGIEIPEDIVAVTPEVISPNNDGFDDFAEFSFSFQDIENQTTITLYNRSGRVVRHLVNNIPCGREALYKWDGSDDHGAMVPTGAYVAIIQWWNNNGKSQRLRRVLGVVNDPLF